MEHIAAQQTNAEANEELVDVLLPLKRLHLPSSSWNLASVRKKRVYRRSATTARAIRAVVMAHAAILAWMDSPECRVSPGGGSTTYLEAMLTLLAGSCLAEVEYKGNTKRVWSIYGVRGRTGLDYFIFHRITQSPRQISDDGHGAGLLIRRIVIPAHPVPVKYRSAPLDGSTGSQGPCRLMLMAV